MDYFVDVALPIPLEKLFTYKVSPEQAELIQPGMRISVPFGKRKVYTSIAIAVHDNPPTVYEAKDIDQILDENPLITSFQLKHWDWIANYYMCTLGEVIRAALPKPFLLESETVVTSNADQKVEDSLLSDDEFLILEALSNQSSLSINDIIEITEKKNVLPILNGLLDKHAIEVKETIYEQYKPKLVRYVHFSEQFTNDEALSQLLEVLSKAPKQRQVVLQLFQLQAQQGGRVKVSDLISASGSSSSIIKSLLNKGVLQELLIREDRILIDQEAEQKQFELSNHQTQALKTIQNAFDANKPALLFGVTSSGKTEVYLKLIEDKLNQGEQVLYLLPEIALTTQLISRLQGYLGNKVAVYHSKYSANERVEVWNNVQNQSENAQVVIGARSSLFLPFSKLGLVIIDEEHEASFKQFDPAPRYHARDSALVLAKLHGAQAVLGSATPSLESFKNAKEGKFGLAELTVRFGEAMMPDVQLIDIKEATRKKKMKGHFSKTLFESIEESLLAGEQIIFFQNRRGFAPVIECTTCGHVEQCPNCDVSLTFHQNKNQLRCHYCGYYESVSPSCKACGNNTLDSIGFGTEQIQQELQKLFPKAHVARMDLDTTRGKYAYQKLIAAFEKKEIDILVGTQMVTKGLDFRNVGLVGILNADTLLNFPDYRAHERTFQLLTQVAGRAGRTAKRGKVLIQSYNPYHKVLQQVTTNSYREMFEEQLYEREQFKYPPSLKIIKLTLKAKDFNRLNEASSWLAQSLRNVFGNLVLGPESPVISRIRREYLKNILLKIPHEQSVSKTKKGIKRIQKSFDAIPMFKSVRLVYDVDHI
ncbi:replication restart helicase PriA [Croceivirga thetidis]|uniref:Replication restart protein PriA n=1 Tax=Croceivirga thetidis TaxID=2721623 RepID=A0ABX1GRN5_9FLAO|nr:primosomal protein N' [Croceivirga thetidis]NKI32602.1 primosomal protein N' [Croceivirga thetidis]